MKTASIYRNLEYNKSKPTITVLFETSFTKEIRIVMKTGQIMKKHQTPYPIVIEMIEGKLDFGVHEENHSLTKGDLIALEGKTPHDLKATEDSIIRLTLTKLDTEDRVKRIVDN